MADVFKNFYMRILQTISGGQAKPTFAAFPRDPNPATESPSLGYGQHSRVLNTVTHQEWVNFAAQDPSDWRPPTPAALASPAPASPTPTSGTVNAKDFGAKGDGQTDDYEALLAAINAALPLPDPNFGTQWSSFDWYGWSNNNTRPQGGGLFIPRGQYYCSKSLPMRGRVRLTGQGATETVIRFGAGADAGFYSEADGNGICGGAILENLAIRTVDSHGIDLTQGLLDCTIRNMLISAGETGIWMPDTSYIQGCLFERLQFVQCGSVAMRLTGNFNKINLVSIKGSSSRTEPPPNPEAMVILKGSGWRAAQLHVETGYPVKSLKIGGPGPTFPGYMTGGIHLDGIWIETPGDPDNNVSIELTDVWGLRATTPALVTSGKTRINRVMDVYFDSIGEVEFAEDDLTSVIHAGSIFHTWGYQGDRSEQRIICDRLLDRYHSEVETPPTGRFGNLLQPRLDVAQRGSDAIATYENVPNIGWCWKITWTIPPTNDYSYIDISFYADFPAGLMSPGMNVYLSAILDYPGDPVDGRLFRVYYGMGSQASHEVAWSRRGPVQAKLVNCTNMASEGLLRLFTGSVPGTVYLKNLALTVGGRFQPPPPPAKAFHSSDGPTMSWANAIPTSGFYASGSVVYNLNPTGTSPAGWQCTESGNPGKWRTL